MGFIGKVLDEALGYVDAILGRSDLQSRVEATADSPTEVPYREQIRQAKEAGDLQAAGLLQVLGETYGYLGGVGDIFSETAREDSMLAKALYGESVGKGEIYTSDRLGGAHGLRWYGQERKYKLLRQAVKRDPIMSSIIQLRTDQISRFVRVPKDKGDNAQKGIIVRRKDREAVEKDKFAETMLDFLIGLGDIDNPYDEDLSTILEMATRDLITLDKITMELMQSKSKGPRGLVYLDPATIFYYYREAPEYKQGYRFCQVLWESCQRTNPSEWPKFRGDEIVVGLSNPISDINRRGEGISVVEMLSSVMATVIRALDYNSRAFTEGSVPPGILNLSGNYSNMVIRQFVNRIKANAAGQHFKIPVISTQKGSVEWTPFSQTNKDLEYNQLLQLLITVECSAAQVDPAEIGFSVQFGGSSSVFGQGEERTKIEESKDRGLAGLLEFLAKWMTRIVHRFPKGDDYLVEFTGYKSRDMQKEAAIQSEMLRAGVIVPFEARQALGLPHDIELPDDVEEEFDYTHLYAPIDAGAQQIFMEKNMAEEEEGMEPPGGPTGHNEYDEMMGQALGQEQPGTLPPGEEQLALPPGQQGAVNPKVLAQQQAMKQTAKLQKAVDDEGRTLKVYEITLPKEK